MSVKGLDGEIGLTSVMSGESEKSSGTIRPCDECNGNVMKGGMIKGGHIVCSLGKWTKLKLNELNCKVILIKQCRWESDTTFVVLYQNEQICDFTMLIADWKMMKMSEFWSSGKVAALVL